MTLLISVSLHLLDHPVGEAVKSRLFCGYAAIFPVVNDAGTEKDFLVAVRMATALS